MNAPLVSIIINNYNYGRFVGEAVRSALNQTYEPIEVIVVDDGSTDSSRDIIAGFGDQVTAVLKANGGQASALNSGFARSRGDFVVFLDADDLLLPSALEESLPLFDPGVMKVHWPLWEVDQDGVRTGRIIPDTPLGTGVLRERTIDRGPVAGNSPPTSGNIWSREFLSRVFPIPEQEFAINSDGYLFTLCWVYGEVRRLNEPQSCYRIHGGNNHAAMDPAAKRAVHLEKFLHHCDALSSHLTSMGIEHKPYMWKLYKGVPDKEFEKTLRNALLSVVPAGRTFILVDENGWPDWDEGLNASQSRTAIPFTEKHGVYWGIPESDDDAIRELERLRARGAEYIVFLWYTQWWLEEFAGFGAYLQQHFECIEPDPAVTIYDLRRRALP